MALQPIMARCRTTPRSTRMTPFQNDIDMVNLTNLINLINMRGYIQMLIAIRTTTHGRQQAPLRRRRPSTARRACASGRRATPARHRPSLCCAHPASCALRSHEKCCDWSYSFNGHRDEGPVGHACSPSVSRLSAPGMVQRRFVVGHISKWVAFS